LCEYILEKRALRRQTQSGANPAVVVT